MGKRQLYSPPDYSFMHVGGVYQSILTATMEAAHRFGPDKAMNVIYTAFDIACRKEIVEMKSEILAETGVKVSDDDLDFLSHLCNAADCLNEAEKYLKEACRG